MFAIANPVSTSAVKIGATCLAAFDAKLHCLTGCLLLGRDGLLDLPLLWLPSFLLGSCALIPVAGFACLLCVFLIYKSIVL